MEWDGFGKIAWGRFNLWGHELKEARTTLHSELDAIKWAMKSMIQHSTCQRFGKDCKDLIAMITDPQAWPNFSTELEVIQTLRLCFSNFKISYCPRTQNEIADSLVRNAHYLFVLLVFLFRSGYLDHLKFE